MPIATPLPLDEAKRLKTLHDYTILDTAPEAAFDRLTSLAADICQAPVSLLTFADRDRLWFKSTHGIKATEVPREKAFCAQTILEDQLLVVRDTTTDERFFDHPLVLGPPHIRSYAGAPLIAPNGAKVGTLCVIHDEVTHLTDRQLAQLESLAAIAIDELQLRCTLLEVTATHDRLKAQTKELKSALSTLESQADRMSILITDREQLYANIDRTRRFIEKLVETVPVAIFLKDERQRIIHANPAYASLVGIELSQIVGRVVGEVFTPERAREVAAQDKELFASNSGYGAFEARIGDYGTGACRDTIAHKAVIRAKDGSVEGVVGAIIDVTEQNVLRDELERLAHTDPLTGAANRRGFFKRAEDEFERRARYGHALSLITIDLDRFKMINDTYGHQTGDKVLQRVSSICTSAIRNSIDLFARMGGEEFAILAPEIDKRGAAALAERLRTEIAQTRMPCSAQAKDVTASFGVMTVEADDRTTSLDDALKLADDCLYISKQRGRNRVTVYGENDGLGSGPIGDIAEQVSAHSL